jgi:2',3'-cyclic-nucleotide 2'-phosphodiesterase (5'-nucleotidase family)
MSTFQLQILHASDLEGGNSDLLNAPNFVALVDALEDKVPNSLFLLSGDLTLPGPYFSAEGESFFQPSLQAAAEALYALPAGSLSGLDPAPGRAEMLLLDLLGASASTMGNHDLDQGPAALAKMIIPEVEGGTLADVNWVGANFPYLSANLDFIGEPALAPYAIDEILPVESFRTAPQALVDGATPPKLAPAATTEIGGERIGIIGVTTQILESITTTGGIDVLAGGTNDMAALAKVIQPVIDTLEADGIDKIVLLSHLQQIQFEQELAPLLDGVDIVIAGGSHQLLADAEDGERGLFPGAGEPYDQYPILTQDAAGDPVAIVNTDGNWRYVGRLVVEFDESGRLIPESIDPALSGVYASTDEQVATLWGSTEAAFAPGAKGEIAQSLIEPIADYVAEQDGNVVGLSSVYLQGERNYVRTEETNLGDLTADANLWYAQQYDPNVTVSLKNGGGIRASVGRVWVDSADNDPQYLPPAANPAVGKPEGGISQLDIASSLRFNNDLSLVTVDRADLIPLVEHAVAASAPDTTPGQFAQVGGLRYSFDWEQAPGQRLQNLAIVDGDELRDVLLVNGTFIGKPDDEVRLVTLGFLADGGDNYPFESLSVRDRIDLQSAGLPEGNVTFAPAGSEQDALAEYLYAHHRDVPYSVAEMPPSEDDRIQNLAFRDDDVLENDPAPLMRLYDAAFDRLPDGSGMAFWLEAAHERELTQIAKGFLDSPEFHDRYGNPAPEDFLDLLYANLFEREPDAPGKTYWLERIEDGTPYETVLIGFIESAEAQALSY